MHMADALLSPEVGAAMCAVSAGAMIYSGVKMKGGREAEKALRNAGNSAGIRVQRQARAGESP